MIHVVVNQKYGTNSYIQHCPEFKSVLIIDPGIDFLEIFKYIDQFEIKCINVLLTHHHFDHMYGLPYLFRKYSANTKIMVYGNSECKVGVASPKSNLSEYSIYQPVSYQGDFNVVDGDELLQMSGALVQFIQTPGHTQSSVSYEIDDCVFVGDLMIAGHRTTTNLPTGSKKIAKKSIEFMINRYCMTSYKIYPGHGTSFDISNYEIEDFIIG